MRNIKRGDIYFADLGDTQGSEQKGIRPVVIIQNDIGNTYSSTIIIAPITTKPKRTKLPIHVEISNVLKQTSTILLEQLRTLDKTRLKEFICHLDNDIMYQIDNALSISLGLYPYFEHYLAKKSISMQY